MEGFIGKGIVSDEEKTLENLAERAKLIARLPIDYVILPSSNHGSGESSCSPSQAPDEKLCMRDKNGQLTEYAREQLLQGRIKCDPAEVPFRGNPMRGRVRTYEIPWMVTMTILASDWVNERCGLSVNLRFLPTTDTS